MIDQNPAKKRVALYVDSLKIGGAERITLTFARWCAESGWTPIVLTRQGLDADFYPIPSGVQRAVEPQEPSWLKRFGRWGFPWRVVRLRHWLRAEAIDLAVGMTTKPSVKLLLAARPLDVPCVVSERNYPPLKRIGRLWSGLRRLSYPWAALHLVQTRAVGTWMAAHLGAHRQFLLPNPVQWPLTRFHPSLEPQHWLEQRGCQASDPLLLAVGTKADQKGFDLSLIHI